ncbi:OmpA family protein [Bacteroidia bacterium]|nr:OmpA family protein [Bacteroidia bacterium]
MKKSTYTFVIFSICTLAACVPTRKFEALQVNYDNLKSDFDEMKSLKDYGDKTFDELKEKYATLEDRYTKLNKERLQDEEELKRTGKSYDILSQNYKNLISSTENTKKNLGSELEKLDKELDTKKRELFAKESSLIAKEQEAAKLKTELDALSISLKEREKKVNELQAKLDSQEKALTDLKNKLTESLIGYKNSGISVVQKDGKIYVSLDNSLLFQSGKTDMDWKGKTALLKVAENLKGLEDFDIMVEGHTDNVPMKTDAIKDNWDLSVLRATSVVRYLTTEGKMNPNMIIPSGRSKYVPINTLETKEARAVNRRIEVILTPKLDQLMEILK